MGLIQESLDVLRAQGGPLQFLQGLGQLSDESHRHRRRRKDLKSVQMLLENLLYHHLTSQGRQPGLGRVLSQQLVLQSLEGEDREAIKSRNVRVG